MAESNTNWCQSVTGIVIRDGRVLLARHTYGGGRGLFIVPGGYLQFGESPVDGVKREIMEETGVAVEPGRVVAIRTNGKDWYMAFEATYLSGEARSDGEENDLVVWMSVEEALARPDVPELTKSLIGAAMKPGGLVPLPYQGNPKNGKGFLFGIE